MILGLTPYTFVHVLISLVAIASGIWLVLRWLAGRTSTRLTQIFLVTTVATNLTGFGFGFSGFTPAFTLGVISTAVLIPTLAALYIFQLANGWRRVFVVGSVIALYFNVFVLIVQSFQKIPVFNALAPTQSEPPFAIAQGIALLLFIVLGVLSWRRFPIAPFSTGESRLTVNQ